MCLQGLGSKCDETSLVYTPFSTACPPTSVLRGQWWQPVSHKLPITTTDCCCFKSLSTSKLWVSLYAIWQPNRLLCYANCPKVMSYKFQQDINTLRLLSEPNYLYGNGDAYISRIYQGWRWNDLIKFVLDHDLISGQWAPPLLNALWIFIAVASTLRVWCRQEGILISDKCRVL
jgi:hypothetical protein